MKRKWRPRAFDTAYVFTVDACAIISSDGRITVGGLGGKATPREMFIGFLSRENLTVHK